MNGIRKFRRRANEFWLENESRNAYVEMTNESNKPFLARAHFPFNSGATGEDVVVTPGETRKVICK